MLTDTLICCFQDTAGQEKFHALGPIYFAEVGSLQQDVLRGFVLCLFCCIVFATLQRKEFWGYIAHWSHCGSFLAVTYVARVAGVNNGEASFARDHPLL
jgi:hypothetical protein